MKAITKTPNLKLLYILIVYIVTFNLNAQNFSGLQNKELNKIDDLTAVISGLLSKLDGNIDKVTVIYDSEKTLKVTIDYTGLAAAYLSASVVDGQRQSQEGISEVDFSLEGKTSPVELEFTLSDDVEAGTEINSTYIEIKVGKSKSSFGKVIFLYNLNKNWKTEINPENLIIPITLEPLGTAANLKENVQKIIIPTKKPILKYNFDATKLKVRKLNTGTLSSTTAINNIDGTWLNTDKTTRNITKIIISNKGKSIQVFGKCTPNDCDWGTKPLIATRGANVYKAIFSTNIATSTFSLKFNGNNLETSQNRVYKTAARGSKQTVETFTKSKMFYAVYTLPKRIPTPTTTTTTTTTNTDNTPQGPENNPISLWEDLVADGYDFEFPYEITNIRMDIYPDKNPKSGVFYYLPTAYHLRWNMDDGYQFNMIYGTAEESESTGNVRITGTLTPGISSDEVKLMKSLLESYAKDNTNYTFSELKIMPIKSVPAISLSSGLEGQYDISADKISVSVSSSIINPIDVSWVTDNKTKEEMQVALTESVGIKGIMTLFPDSATVPEQLIPVRVTLADTRTIGRLTLQPNVWRNENWVNNTPFPIRLKKVHALIIEKQGNKSIPLIYSWDLYDTEVPVKSQVTFNASKMPKWIETKNQTKRIWLDYSIVDCSSCVNKVIDQLTSGTTNSKVKNITFESFKVFETTKAAFLKIKVHSLQADPKGESIIELPSVRVTQDMSIFSTGPLYLPDETEPNFEYFFTLVMPDGLTYNSDYWLSSNEIEMFVGMHTLKEAIPSIQTLFED